MGASDNANRESAAEGDTCLNVFEIEESGVMRTIDTMTNAVSQSSEDRGPMDPCRVQDVRIAVIGNVDSGKSTLVGVLTTGRLDDPGDVALTFADGRGAARRAVFNFLHEQENGRTSSVAHEIMGFREIGGKFLPVDVHGVMRGEAFRPDECVGERKAVFDSFGDRASVAKGSGAPGGETKGAAACSEHTPYKRTPQLRNLTWSRIVKNSTKIVTFIDLCGHERYLKTTVFGLVGCLPDYAMIVAGGNAGVQRMTKEHLGIALALRVPTFIIVTKKDAVPTEVFKKTVIQLQRLMKVNAPKQHPPVIRTPSEAQIAAAGAAAGHLCPIFCVSNVTGECLDVLRLFISELNSRATKSIPCYQPPSGPVEFLIDSSFNVPGVGTVVSGTMKSGTVRVNQHVRAQPTGDAVADDPFFQLLLGPDKNGEFKPVLVRGVHVKRVPVHSVESGRAASFALRSLVKKDQLKRTFLRKGMVLIDQLAAAKAVWEFEADVLILHHATTLKPRYQAVVHCGVIRQSAKVLDLTGSLMRTGDKGAIRFRFMYNPEYISAGLPLLFREGRTKGVGRITKVLLEAKPKAAQDRQRAPVVL